MKTTAKAPANIALIKYWGKKNETLRIPVNDSLAICLDKAFTMTTVEFRENLKKDKIIIDKKEAIGKEKERVIKHLNKIRKKAGIKFFAQVVSKNSFPAATGLASSASGFAALTLAGSKAVGLNLSEKELSRLARLGSGSACRSIPDGFVYWHGGNSDRNSYAYSLYPLSYWNLRDLTIIIQKEKKKISSTKGHQLAFQNPFLKARLELVKENLKKIKKAFKNKDFSLLGKVIESETLSLHSVMLTSQPALIYWQPVTLAIIHKVIDLREKRELESYFTIDAGPNVHLICQKGQEKKLKQEIQKMNGVKKIVINKPAVGARLINKHLF
ncbi:diphosphomevalonate decarboxylase [Candidatus Microgenomates bacterium]|nr:diphosphomevalonate decarboxylase [Candidatus Microgenomates bacterium]